METKLNLKDLSIGTAAAVVGFNRIYGGYVGKLLSKKLTVGKELVLLDKDLPEGRVKIKLEDKIVQLSKAEANAIYVEVISKNATD